MKRLIEKTVFCGLVTAWRLATVPTSRSPETVKATTEGVVRPPSAFSITVGSPPSSTAMHEFVVPRSMPMVLPMNAPLNQLNKPESQYRRFPTGFKARRRAEGAGTPQTGRNFGAYGNRGRRGGYQCSSAPAGAQRQHHGRRDPLPRGDRGSGAAVEQLPGPARPGDLRRHVHA